MQKEVYSFAAFSLFSKLSRRINIKEIIMKFITTLISDNKFEYAVGFSVTDIKLNLEDEFGFKIPISVLNQCLRSIEGIYRQNNVYYIDQSTFKFEETPIDLFDSVHSNSKFVQSLFSYISNETGLNLTSIDENEILNNLYKFLMEKDLHLDNIENKKYTIHISSYLLSKESDEHINTINAIKEGAILLTGLSYNSSSSRQNKWTQPIDIFLETEILFYLAGYNGLVYQQMAKDVLYLIKDVNKKDQILNLYIFDDTENQIENFFDNAVNLISKNDLGSNLTDAMRHILSNSKAEIDVDIHRSKFWELLDSYKISVLETPSIINFPKFNLTSSERLKIYSDNNMNHIDRVSQINIIREGFITTDLTKSKALVLTAKKQLILCSNQIIAEESDSLADSLTAVPYHVSMTYLSSRLWYDLNKGFGNDLPASLDVISKAKIILSNELSNKLVPAFDDLINKYNSGELTNKNITESLASLRSRMSKPEEINTENIDDIKEILGYDVIDIETQRIFQAVKEKKDIEKQYSVLKGENESLRVISENKELQSKRLIQYIF